MMAGCYAKQYPNEDQGRKGGKYYDVEECVGLAHTKRRDPRPHWWAHSASNIAKSFSGEVDEEG